MKNEIEDLFLIQEELEKISITVETMRLWSEQMLANNVINMKIYQAHKEKRN